MLGDSQAGSHLKIAFGSLPIRRHAKVFCGAHQFPKYHILIPKTDYNEINYIFKEKNETLSFKWPKIKVGDER